nr:MAG TPA: hypothetical protein [Caudoviricetes sp.]
MRGTDCIFRAVKSHKKVTTTEFLRTIDRSPIHEYNIVNISPRPLLASLRCYTHTWGRSVF